MPSTACRVGLAWATSFPPGRLRMGCPSRAAGLGAFKTAGLGAPPPPPPLAGVRRGELPCLVILTCVLGGMSLQVLTQYATSARHFNERAAMANIHMQA